VSGERAAGRHIGHTSRRESTHRDTHKQCMHAILVNRLCCFCACCVLRMSVSLLRARHARRASKSQSAKPQQWQCTAKLHRVVAMTTMTLSYSTPGTLGSAAAPRGDTQKHDVCAILVNRLCCFCACCAAHGCLPPKQSKQQAATKPANTAFAYFIVLLIGHTQRYRTAHPTR
jgi:hypothetical protein